MGEANLRPTSYQLHLKSSRCCTQPMSNQLLYQSVPFFPLEPLQVVTAEVLVPCSEHKIKNLQPAVIDYDDFGMPGMYTYGYNYSDGCHIFDSNGCARMYEYIGVQSCTGVYSIRISADPACSRGSASEEKLQAARSMARGPFLEASQVQAARSKKQEVRNSKEQEASGEGSVLEA